MTDIIAPERMEQALNYLADTDADYAEAKADLERREIMRKRIRNRHFLVADGTVAERQAEADTDVETEAADDAYIDAVKKFETLRTRRQTEEILIDVWRSLEASRRKA